MVQPSSPKLLFALIANPNEGFELDAVESHTIDHHLALPLVQVPEFLKNHVSFCTHPNSKVITSDDFAEFPQS